MGAQRNRASAGPRPGGGSKVYRRFSALVVLAMLGLAACRGGDRSPGAGLGEADRAAVYQTVIRRVAFQPIDTPSAVLIYTHVCPDADQPVTGSTCDTVFSAKEQQQILAGLGDLPSPTFVSSPNGLTDGGTVLPPDLLKKRVLVRVGPIGGSEDRVTVPASAYCGTDCGVSETVVVQRANGKWVVTGSETPAAPRS